MDTFCALDHTPDELTVLAADILRQARERERKSVV
jgi:hypothetical protein